MATRGVFEDLSPPSNPGVHKSGHLTNEGDGVEYQILILNCVDSSLSEVGAGPGGSPQSHFHCWAAFGSEGPVPASEIAISPSHYLQLGRWPRASWVQLP